MASNSELVVPMMRANDAVGVLDLDSPVFDRFDADDSACCEALARLWIAGSDPMETQNA